MNVSNRLDALVAFAVAVVAAVPRIVVAAAGDKFSAFKVSVFVAFLFDCVFDFNVNHLK